MYTLSKEQEFKTFSMLTQFESCIHLLAFVAEVFFFFNIIFFGMGVGNNLCACERQFCFLLKIAF